jgi:hypothetical protein
MASHAYGRTVALAMHYTESMNDAWRRMRIAFGSGFVATAEVTILDGDPTLFICEDVGEGSWRIVEAVLDGTTPMHVYGPRSRVPSHVEQLFSLPGGWHDPVVTPKQRA